MKVLEIILLVCLVSIMESKFRLNSKKKASLKIRNKKNKETPKVNNNII